MSNKIMGMKIFLIAFSILTFIQLSCNNNENSGPVKIKNENEKQKYYGTYKSWNGKDSTRLILYDKAYFINFKDTSKICYDYDIDYKIIRLFNPRYEVNHNGYEKLYLFHSISYDYKDEIRFYDIIDTNTIRGVSIEFTKVK